MSWQLTIEGTDHTISPLVRNVRVDHGGAHILMSKQGLQSTYIASRLEHVRCETMAKGVRRDPLVDACIAGGLPYRPLNPLFFNMVATHFAGARVG